MRCKHCGNIENKPASWDCLSQALKALDSETVVSAIVTQLKYSQPSGEVYEFLSRTLQLATTIPLKRTPLADLDAQAHELWVLAQCSPLEGIEDAVDRIIEFLSTKVTL